MRLLIARQQDRNLHGAFFICLFVVFSRDSSVGRATDCRGIKFSVGRVFESPSRDLKQSKHDENVVSIVFI